MLKKKKKHALLRTCLDNQSWRRRRGSNPRTLLHVYELSKPAPSASWVLLRKLTSILDVRIVLYQKINNNHYLFYKCFFLE